MYINMHNYTQVTNLYNIYKDTKHIYTLYITPKLYNTYTIYKHMPNIQNHTKYDLSDRVLYLIQTSWTNNPNINNVYIYIYTIKLRSEFNTKKR